MSLVHCSIWKSMRRTLCKRAGASPSTRTRALSGTGFYEPDVSIFAIQISVELLRWTHEWALEAHAHCGIPPFVLTWGCNAVIQPTSLTTLPRGL
jgi:hypothetical protein